MGIRMFAISIAAVVTSQFIGCTSVKMADPARSAEIKNFEPKAGVAQLYVCRSDPALGAGTKPTVEIDGRWAAIIPVSTYWYIELSPGQHTIVASMDDLERTKKFTVTSGEQKFIQLWFTKFTSRALGVMEELDVEKGMDCVRKDQLVEGFSK